MILLNYLIIIISVTLLGSKNGISDPIEPYYNFDSLGQWLQGFPGCHLDLYHLEVDRFSSFTTSAQSPIRIFKELLNVTQKYLDLIRKEPEWKWFNIILKTVPMFQTAVGSQPPVLKNGPSCHEIILLASSLRGAEILMGHGTLRGFIRKVIIVGLVLPQERIKIMRRTMTIIFVWVTKNSSIDHFGEVKLVPGTIECFSMVSNELKPLVGQGQDPRSLIESIRLEASLKILRYSLILIYNNVPETWGHGESYNYAFRMFRYKSVPVLAKKKMERVLGVKPRDLMGRGRAAEVNYIDVIIGSLLKLKRSEYNGSNFFSTMNIIDINISLGYTDKVNPDFQLVVTGQEDFGFITCNGLGLKGSGSNYLDSCDSWTWGFILGTLVMAAGILSCGLEAVQGLTAKVKFFGMVLESLCYFYLGVAWFSGVKEGPRKFLRLTRFTFTFLALLYSILSNSYKAIITERKLIFETGSEVIPWESFAQLGQFNLSVLVRPNFKKFPHLYTGTIRIWDPEVPDPFNASDPYYPSLFGQQLVLLAKDNDYKNPSRFHSLFNMLKLQAYDDVLNILKELETCSKTGFIGTNAEIQDVLGHERHDRQTGKLVQRQQEFRFGKERILPMTYGLIFHKGGHGTDLLVSRLNSLISTGIYKMWEDLFFRKSRAELDPGQRMTIKGGQGSDSYVWPIFKILKFGLGTAMVVEIVQHFWFAYSPRLNFELSKRKIFKM